MGCRPTKGPAQKKPRKQPHLLQEIHDHRSGINFMVLSDDGSLLVTGSDDRTARMWSTLSDPTECLGVLEGHEDTRIHGLVSSFLCAVQHGKTNTGNGSKTTCNGPYFATVYGDSPTEQPIFHFIQMDSFGGALLGYITCCAIHEQCVLTGSSDTTIRKWFIATAECLAVYTGHTARISRLLCAGQLIFSTSSDHMARAWLFDLSEVNDEQGETCIKIFEGHSKGTYPMIHIPMDEDAGLDLGAGVLVTGSADCTARSWSVDSGLCLKIFRGHTAPLNCLCLDNTKNVLYTSGGDGLIRSWNLMSGEAMKVLRGHEGPVFCLMIHKRMLYSGSSDKTARSWVLEFGECTRIYAGHRHTVSSIRLFDGMLYTGCGDTIARMFEAKSGTLKRTFKGHENAIVCVEVVPGKLFTGSYDGSIRVWNTAGVKDETVFGTDYNERDPRDDEMEEDSEDVQNAVKSLDPYLTY